MQAVDAAGEVVEHMRVDRRAATAGGATPRSMRWARSSRRRSIAVSAAAGIERSICARVSAISAPSRADSACGAGLAASRSTRSARSAICFSSRSTGTGRDRGGGEQIAHFFGLGANALEGGGIDDALGDRVDLGAKRAQLALEPGDGGVRVMGAQRLARLGDQRGQRVARAAVAKRGDAFAEIAHRAFERDDRVARREIGEAARHRRQLAAQRLDVDAAGAGCSAWSRRIFSSRAVSAAISSRSGSTPDGAAGSLRRADAARGRRWRRARRVRCAGA